MWKLDRPSAETINWYKGKMLSGLIDRVQNSSLLPEVKNILLPIRIPLTHDTSVLECLLTNPPVEAKMLNDYLMKKIEEILIYKKNPERLSTLRQEILDIFDYDGQISKSQSKSYYLTHRQGRFTCTYCNRNYTITIISRAQRSRGDKIGKNDDERIARPHLDHWFDKADYPLLSLNLFNLIPSCPVCNSAIKGKTKFDLSTHVHPYLTDKVEPNFRFVLKPNSEANSDFPFIVGIDETSSSAQERKTIEDLCLKDVYAYHGMLEAKDIYDWRIENSLEYLKDIFAGVMKKYRRSTEDVFKMFFGTEYDKNKNLDRPFSKLKRDILIQYGLLDSKGHFN